MPYRLIYIVEPNTFYMLPARHISLLTTSPTRQGFTPIDS